MVGTRTNSTAELLWAADQHDIECCTRSYACKLAPSPMSTSVKVEVLVCIVQDKIGFVSYLRDWSVCASHFHLRKETREPTACRTPKTNLRFEQRWINFQHGLSHEQLAGACSTCTTAFTAPRVSFRSTLCGNGSDANRTFPLQVHSRPGYYSVSTSSQILRRAYYSSNTNHNVVRRSISVKKVISSCQSFSTS